MPQSWSRFLCQSQVGFALLLRADYSRRPCYTLDIPCQNNQFLRLQFFHIFDYVLPTNWNVLYLKKILCEMSVRLLVVHGYQDCTYLQVVIRPVISLILQLSSQSFGYFFWLDNHSQLFHNYCFQKQLALFMEVYQILSFLL